MKLILFSLAAIILIEAVILGNFAENDCKNLDVSKKQQCWQALMEKTLQKGGLDQAFILMDELFKSDPSFAPTCHGFAHLLGEKAYDLYSQKKDLALSTKASYCGYGFYHGFIEKLLKKTNDMNQARAFCKYAGEKLKDKTIDAEGACYHGIGHGALEDVTDPKKFGNVEKIIAPSLELCERVSDNEAKLFRCVTGVFNALEIVTSEGRYNLSINIKDPLIVCRTQPDKYKRACYTQMVVAVMHATNNDFLESAKILDTIAEDDWAEESLSGLVMGLIQQGKTDYQEAINFCRSLPDRFKIPCVTGFGEGFLKHGPPQEEYIKAVDLCSSNLLSDEEKKACFSRILSILRIWYTVEKSQTICQRIDPKYQWNKCQYN